MKEGLPEMGLLCLAGCVLVLLATTEHTKRSTPEHGRCWRTCACSSFPETGWMLGRVVIIGFGFALVLV